MLLACGVSIRAQVTTGTVRGVVTDQSGAVVPNATVTIMASNTKTSQTAQSGSGGEYQFNNLAVGPYTVTVQPPSGSNFGTLTLSDVRVQLNQVTDVQAVLQPSEAQASVTVSASGAELVDSTTINLSRDFSSRQVVDLAQTGQIAGIYNLALISPNVTSGGGVGVGTGGSVGGQRPRNNNFVVDGIDNNDKGVTGPQIYVSPESVAEFNVLTNQASAEFARSTGGQFITVTKSGSNDFHGTVFEFLRNRKLNAIDNLQTLSGITRDSNPRFDQNRFGFNIGGPLYIPSFGEGGRRTFPWSGKNKLFFFFQFERMGLGQAASPGNISAPTAEGIALLQNLSGVSATNLAVFRQFVPVAPTNNAGTIPVCAVNRDASGACPGGNQIAVPVGNIAFAAPNFQNNRNVVFNVDFVQSSKTEHHSRFIFNSGQTIDNAANFPDFFATVPTEGRLFSYTLIHNFTPKLTNETRLAYRRFLQRFPIPADLSFPGLDQFPNVTLDDLGINIGPDPGAPQFAIENSYQIVDQATYTHGQHAIKFGVDWRNIISPQSFVQRSRGDYQYPNLDLFLRDIQPSFGERTVGQTSYYGNQQLFYAFAQDDWRIRPRFSLNLGVNYVYQQVPFSARLQTLNAIASVPGVLTFNEPRAQKKNFAPRVGFAYSPNFQSGLLHAIFGNADESSLRGSFAMAYDTIIDNFYILSLPPQLAQTVDVGTNFPGTPLVTPNFLRNGGIPPTSVGTTTDPVAARAATSAFIPDQQVPYSLSWGLTYQREFHKDYALEVRYLGSRGVHLPTQSHINIQDVVSATPGNFLPTFLSAPSQASLDSLTTTLDELESRDNVLPSFAKAGFTSPITAFLSNGNSTYHSGSASLTRRFSSGLQFSTAYTWSHLIDDSTAEVFSTVLSPRRVQDFQNLRPEKADSALDHRHRFVAYALYDLPFFKKSNNHLARTFLGGISTAATVSFETGSKATVLSGIDSNLNGDPAPDRTIINLSGVANTSSTVTPLLNSRGQIVAYLANNPNAQYIQTGLGALSNAGRNTLQLRPIQNVDFSLFKNFALGEVRKIQLRVDLYNAFNHPQYVPGSVDGVDPIGTTGVGQFNTVGLNDFNIASHVFSSHPRVIQLALRFDF